MFKQSFQIIEDIVVEKRAIASATALIGFKGQVFGPEAFGHLSYFPQSPATKPDTIFDLASVSKVVGTTTIALKFLEDKLIALDDPLAKYFPDVPADKKDITIEQLLTHTSGIRAHYNLYEDERFKNKETAHIPIFELPLSYQTGTAVEYSCLGFIILGFILEKVANKTLAELFSKLVAQPLQLKDTEYNPPEEKVERIAFTEWDPIGKEFLQGKVHDENARSLGGISGNAGLFGTAEDLSRFCQMLLQDGSYGNLQLLQPSTIQLLQKNYTPDPKEPRTLGWLLPSPEACSGSKFISRRSIGHTGFTGTSIWLDFERKFYGVLLTNRVHPTRENTIHLQMRPRFYGAICQTIDQA